MQDEREEFGSVQSFLMNSLKMTVLSQILPFIRGTTLAIQVRADHTKLEVKRQVKE